MAEIYDQETGDMLTCGLQGSDICDEAIHAAQNIASDRGEAVLLVDDGGEWVVCPTGSCTLQQPHPAYYILCQSATHEYIDGGPFETLAEALDVMRRSAERYASLLGCVIKYGGGDTAREIREMGEIVADADDYYEPID